MTATRWTAGLVGLLALVGEWSGSAGAANPTKAQVCEALKNTAAGAKAACLARAQALAMQGRTANFAICETEFIHAGVREGRVAPLPMVGHRVNGCTRSIAAPRREERRSSESYVLAGAEAGTLIPRPALGAVTW